MKEEIRVGIEFLRQFLTKYGHQLSPQIIDSFAKSLTATLHTRYANHWYSDMPMKGQAFRCLRLKRSENYIDPTLEAILKQFNLTLSQLGLPNDFTLWIDPGEVSVRFGDQVGYTYTIAKLDETQLQKQDSLSDTDVAVSEVTSSSSNLIVESAEKILFDEKLTAFIRQNSSSNEESLADALTEFNTIEETEEQEDLNMDEFIKLSAEQRTISPPCSSILTRKNSANIAIFYDETTEAAKSADSQINNRTVGSNSSYGSLPGRQRRQQEHQQPGKFSFSDSCYYSSSSSSCASSFGSNYDEGNSQLSRFIKSSSNISGKSNFNNYFGSAEDSLPFTKNPQNNNLFFSPIDQSFGFLNEPVSNPNIFSGSTSSSLFNQMDNSIYSESSSERSDTPNSCITNASSYLSSANQFVGSLNHAIVPFSASSTPDRDAAVSCSTGSSSSSDTSTTTLSTRNSFDTKNACDDMDLFDADAVPTVVKQQQQLVNSKNSFSKNQAKENNKGDSSKNNEKDEKYCGYVESFPYYYKLNRLYNALAVQKMQTERLRKSNNVSPMFNGQQAAVGTSLAYSPSQMTSQVAANQMQFQQMRNGKMMAKSPSNFNYPLAGSPFGSELQSSVLISETSPPLNQHVLNKNPTANMHNMNR